ncbi:hypothetical protein [Aerosakkonema funiforme]|uniref:Bacteriocin n=1 Tax=Aerosakkonema funiforme FACHB-1375 TaxID=2949571 RepID=A0A926VE66_9CYAN|nr:hypothetical protein [Aerosakkonema funiforme]MBD2181950.1 hypothetical protein [Aerosakkonema funiforme FACHB-1375]
MSDIKITDLLAGSEFFADDESFMNDLAEEELTVWGGGGLLDNSISGISGEESILNSLEISKSVVSVTGDVSIST